MEKYKNKNILVTGGSGFIGSRLAERLVLEEKANVRVLVHTWPKATWVSRLGADLVQGDISIQEDVDKAVAGNEIVFHCVGVGGSMEQCMKTNFEGTNNVLNACKKYGVRRIVYLSSIVVHGPATYEGMDEKAQYTNGFNPYADSKIETEKYFVEFIRKNGIEGVIIRPTYVWGPVSPYYTVDIIKQMKAGAFMLADGGAGSCNAVHVDNVVDLSLLCGLHPKAAGEIFFSVDGEKITWKEFWGYFAKMAGKDITRFTSIPSREHFRRRLSLNIKRKLLSVNDKLTLIINKYDVLHPKLTRYGLRGPRKVLKTLIKSMHKLTPEMDPWDLLAYSALGFISIEKSKLLLGYSPRIMVREGMKDCEVWLRDQNYI